MSAQVATCELEDRCQQRQKARLTLPAAVAMSGAAISPSMGKKTRRRYRFLLALANVRLGVWVPNPRVGGQRMRATAATFGRPFRPSHLLRELLGLNRSTPAFCTSPTAATTTAPARRATAPWLHDLYCFDAGDGTSLRAVDAVSLARSELGVEIDIDPRRLVPDKDRHLAECDCVRAHFRYDNGVPGVLVYARTVMTEAVPFDVTAYHDADPLFPHNSTADQLYTDQKFEAYRALGWCAGGHAADEMTAPTYGAARVQTPVAHIARNGDSEPLVSVPVGGRYRLNLRQALRSKRA